MILMELLMIAQRFIPWPEVKEQSPTLSTAQLVSLIKQVKENL
jgi:hypothetical protein